MNSHGIPSLKELYAGVMIDVDSSTNRHLQMSGLSGRRIYLEMVEEPSDFDDDEEAEEEEDENFDPMGLAPDTDLVDEEDEEVGWTPCAEYPDGCLHCEDIECWHDGDAPIDDEVFDERLRVAILWPALGDVPRDMSEEEIEQNPALCRFLSQINAHNGL
jgi:hypothetical protein